MKQADKTYAGEPMSLSSRTLRFSMSISASGAVSKSAMSLNAERQSEDREDRDIRGKRGTFVKKEYEGVSNEDTEKRKRKEGAASDREGERERGRGQREQAEERKKQSDTKTKTETRDREKE